VLNTGPQGGGGAVFHRAACGTIGRNPPFTSGFYIQVCSSSLDSLDRSMLSRAGSIARRCGICRPSPGSPP
jgi:hypothetical protein